LGIYIGPSPRHARSVALILNPKTGLTSPQFHVNFDNDFDTVKGTTDKAHGEWKSKCGFEKASPQRHEWAIPRVNKTSAMTPHPVPMPEHEGANVTEEVEHDFAVTDDNEDLAQNEPIAVPPPQPHPAVRRSA